MTTPETNHIFLQLLSNSLLPDELTCKFSAACSCAFSDSTLLRKRTLQPTPVVAEYCSLKSQPSQEEQHSMRLKISSVEEPKHDLQSLGKVSRRPVPTHLSRCARSVGHQFSIRASGHANAAPPHSPQSCAMCRYRRIRSPMPFAVHRFMLFLLSCMEVTALTARMLPVQYCMPH